MYSCRLQKRNRRHSREFKKNIRTAAADQHGGRCGDPDSQIDRSNCPGETQARWAWRAFKMSAQQLSILDLRDIVMPAPAGPWPPVPFVWVLLGAVCFGLAVLIWRIIVRRRAGAYRRQGLARLSQMEPRLLTKGEEAAALADLSVLLKRVALAAFPRRQVASLA